MTDRSSVERAFAAHDAYGEREANGYAVESTPFEAWVDAEAVGDGWHFRVTVRLPTLPAVVEGEVGDAVADGWLETLELRLEDAYDVVRVDRTDPPGVARDRAAGVVVAEFGFETADAERGVDAAAAIVDYVEGTYVQGMIPGYEYGPPVSGLLDRARRTGHGGDAPP